MMNEEKSKDQRRLTFKKLKGVVLSNKMHRTLVVQVETTESHPVYKKVFKKSKKYKVHCDDERLYPEGSIVTIVYARPLSKEKSWRILKSENQSKES